MATEKKSEQTNSVEERLRSLYKLQTILTEIDRIKTIRGELPLEVSDLEDTITGLQKRIENFNEEKREIEKIIYKRKEDSHNYENLIAKYKEQLNNITNNLQYDMLSKEIERESLNIELAHKHIKDYERDIESKMQEIKATEEKLSDLQHILNEKKSELDEIVSETRQEEENLREKAKELEPKIDEFTLKAFKRIRKNARNGLGIVYVQRNACGGCFNRIPPQRQMEIKMHKKVIVCEYCGRIIIDPALAGIEETAE